MNYFKYRNIIFDFDGVIVDSNFIKKKCIAEVSKQYCGKDYHDQFVEYFTKNNGVPREVKINIFFNHEIACKVINSYNGCLAERLREVRLTSGLREFIKSLNFYENKLYVLSGGTQSEVYEILKFKKLEENFTKIMGGPDTKEENINTSKIEGRTLFIGDSLKDYEIADKYEFDFIFMYGYTQFNEWKEFFKDKNILMSIKNFSVLINRGIF